MFWLYLQYNKTLNLISMPMAYKSKTCKCIYDSEIHAFNHKLTTKYGTSKYAIVLGGKIYVSERKIKTGFGREKLLAKQRGICGLV